MSLETLRRTFRLALVVMVPSACSSAAAPPRESVGSTDEPVAGGQADTNDPVTSDVVVRLASGDGCTGVLITPTAVLTAKHCICNAVSSFDVTLGADVALPIHTYKVTLANPAHPAVVFGSCPLDSPKLWGDDVGIVFLDEASPPVNPTTTPQGGPAFDHAYIHRPTFAAPCASDSSSCPDANGGQYNPPLGMAGYAPPEGERVRQVAFQSVFNHSAGYPDGVGQFWQHSQGSVYLNHGDSGGPLFATRTDEAGHPFRDVLGVAASTYAGYDYWTDITRGAIRDWVIANVTDKLAGHTPLWRAKHPKIQWLGEVDYLGACQQSVDVDCDHFYDVGDNCPTVFNPGQLATQGVELGDACNAPTGCAVFATCASPPTATFSCTRNTAPRTFLEYRARGTDAWTEGTLYKVDNPALYEYRVCGDYAYGRACTGALFAGVNPSCAGPSCTASTSCPLYRDGPPDITVSCSSGADFYTETSTNGPATLVLQNDTRYVGSTSDYAGFVLACTPNEGLSHCASFSSYVGRANWCVASGGGGGGGGGGHCRGDNCCHGTCQ